MNGQKSGRLAGRRALITGASRGIGRAIAERYAAEGADLFLTATSMGKLEETRDLVAGHGGRVFLHTADVSDRDQVEAMIKSAVAAMGGIDIAVNNAGVYKAARFVDYTADEFDQVMKVNAYGVFHVMQFVLRHMLERGAGGKIVNVASTAGKWESMNQSAYNASKHAVVGMTRCAALETAASGITINAICPGFVDTDMIDAFRAHADIAGVPFEQIKAGAIQRVPMGRMLDPVEIAHLAVYLGASESDGMTGQTITISGGMRMG
jgi:meso-butanediol dehydrogenase/(S,S)-butanediol dehydrogenase/diacetyl reductase